MTDEMRLLLEAFALEAGDQVVQLTQTFKKLERTPGNPSGWRAASTTFRLIADSAMMMELPEVQRLAHHGRDACKATHERADWQTAVAVTHLQALTAALAALLKALQRPDQAGAAPAISQGELAYRRWCEEITGVAPAIEPPPSTPRPITGPLSLSQPNRPKTGPLGQAAEPPTVLLKPSRNGAQPITGPLDQARLRPVTGPLDPAAATPRPITGPLEPTAEQPATTWSASSAVPTNDSAPVEPAHPRPVTGPLAATTGAEIVPTIGMAESADPAAVDERAAAEAPIEGRVVPTPLDRMARWRRAFSMRQLGREIHEAAEALAFQEPASGPLSPWSPPEVLAMEAEATAQRPLDPALPSPGTTIRAMLAASHPLGRSPELPANIDQLIVAASPATDEALTDAASAPVKTGVTQPATEPFISSLASPLAEPPPVVTVAEVPPSAEAMIVPTDVAGKPTMSAGELASLAIDAELLEIFVEELGEHLTALDDHVATLRATPTDDEALREARRSLHTIKGAAGMIGLKPVQALGRVSEETVEYFVDSALPAPAALIELIERTVTALHCVHDNGFEAASLLQCDDVSAQWYLFAQQLSLGEPPIEAMDDASAPIEAEPLPEPAADLWRQLPEDAPPFWMAERPMLEAIATHDEVTTLALPALPTELVAELPAEELEITATARPTNQIDDRPLLTTEPMDIEPANPLTMAALTAEPADAASFEAPVVEAAAEASAELRDVVPAEAAGRHGEDDEAALLAVFAAETAESLQTIEDLLAQLQAPAHGNVPRKEQRQVNQQLLAELRRQLHTIKGAAGMMSQTEFSSLAHRQEDLLERLQEEALPLTPAVVGLLFDTVGLLRDLATGQRQEATARALTTRYTAALGAAQAMRTAAGNLAQPSLPPTGSSQSVRLDIEQLGELTGLTEELVTNRAAFEERLNLLGGLLRDFERSVERLARVSRSLEYDFEAWGVATERPLVEENDFDELEFDRYTEFHRLRIELAEAVADARTIGREVTGSMTALNALAGRQGRVTTAMRERLDTARLLPLQRLTTSIRRIVNQTALHEAKQVEITTVGLEVAVDRTVHESVNTALGHLLRNAIVHGIEAPAVREQAGKSATGQITVEARQAQHETVITVRDDGAGIDRQRVRAAAEADGWRAPERELSDDQLLELIFRPGLSTSGQIDELAGRGVGMDAVRAAISAVRGRLVVASTPAQGTLFTLHLPLLVTVAEVLLVDCANHQLALPIAWLSGTLRVETARLQATADGYRIEVAGQPIRVLSLAGLLGWPASLTDQFSWPGVVVQAGEERVVLVVDSLLQRQELTISSLGPSFGWLRSVQGAAVLGNGRVAPVLDLVALLETGRMATQRVAVAERRVRVLVCDDSVSVRRVVAMALERQGWEIVQARNGHEALAVLATGPIDLALLDIEMPQMDGYTLLERLRADEHHARLPVAMLTSRGADKHRERAFQLGANAYLVKPYQEEHLLETLRQLLAISPSGPLAGAGATSRSGVAGPI
jgi:chemotaxis protein histidine kinase CheA